MNEIKVENHISTIGNNETWSYFSIQNQYSIPRVASLFIDESVCFFSLLCFFSLSLFPSPIIVLCFLLFESTRRWIYDEVCRKWSLWFKGHRRFVELLHIDWINENKLNEINTVLSRIKTLRLCGFDAKKNEKKGVLLWKRDIQFHKTEHKTEKLIPIFE